MKKNGFISVEAIIVFPMIVILIVVFIFTLINITNRNFRKKEYTYISDIYKVDSFYRKVSFLDYVKE